MSARALLDTESIAVTLRRVLMDPPIRWGRGDVQPLIERDMPALLAEVKYLRAHHGTGRLSAATARLTLDRVRVVLATFYRAPLSMSSVQPILTLAEELNPSLKERA